MKTIVVGSGAGGATAAYELSARGFEVSLLETGKHFQPFDWDMGLVNRLRGLGILGGEGTINRVYPAISATRSSRDLVLVRGVSMGGSTTISCGSALRAENGFKEIGLDLSNEFCEVEKILKPMTLPRSRWAPVTGAMMDAAEDMGLRPSPTPKMINPDRCVSCGLCELGCRTGAKWSSERLFTDIRANNGEIHPETRVRRVIIENGRAKGVEAFTGGTLRRYFADEVILAAGGVGTAQILRASGIQPAHRLWVDVVLTVGGSLRNAKQFRENPMAWYVKRPGYMISPYPDLLSHLFHKPWRTVSFEDRVGVMVKLADEPNGSIELDGTAHKELATVDRERLAQGVEEAKSVMRNAGVGGPYTEGLLNGGHLGGTAPLTADTVKDMRPGFLPDDLWVADLSLLPRSQGLPAIMTTMALALGVARRIG
jgi:choline dehydrogenase-like flavoprotein